MEDEREAFDFSLDDHLFRQRLLLRLQEAAPGPRQLADDDLDWVAAAGEPDCKRKPRQNP